MALSALVGLSAHLFPAFATVHAAATVVVGLVAALRRRPEGAVLVASYAAGSEILWRIAGARVPYELGKYAVIAVLLLALLTMATVRGGTVALPFLYLALLVPSAVLTFEAVGLVGREFAAFALAGPAALAVAVVFFSQFRASTEMVRRILWTFVLTSTATAVVTALDLSRDLSSGVDVAFGDQSNFFASGGFGPVQVSSALGLGVVACILLATTEPNHSLRALEVALAVAIGVQTMLTFSRGGIYTVAIAVVVYTFMRFRVRRASGATLVVIAGLGAIVTLLVVPWLNDFTEGAFAERFSDTRTGRTGIAVEDVEIFTEHPVFGVGPGMAKYEEVSYEVCRVRRAGCVDPSSHTEFTRMLSEHGLFGLAALGLLAAMVVRAYRRAGPTEAPFTAAMLAWALAHMAYANLRLVAAAFVFGLAFLSSIRPKPEPEPPQVDDRERPTRATPPRNLRPPSGNGARGRRVTKT